MKKIILFTSLILLSSCSSKDEQFCNCLKAGDKLNSFSSNMFYKEITPKLEKEMQLLRATKASACKDYLTMDGEKMLEFKEECK